MTVDWFTFAAQIVNFLVLVALLKWLLYGRIVQAMNEREEKIANRMKDAEAARSEADEKAQQYDQKLATIESEHEERLKEARRDAQEEHERLIQEAREQVDQRREKWQQAYRRERSDLLMDLRRQAGSVGADVARQTLQQLADVELEQRMCDAFSERIRQLDQDQRKEISHHLGNGATKVSVRSAFELPSGRRDLLRETFRETFQSNAEVTFETSPELIIGVEMNVGGFSFGWNAKDFIDDIELEFDQQLSSIKE